MSSQFAVPSSAPRPKLGCRSISDVSPLVEPTRDHASRGQDKSLPGLSGSRVRAPNLVSGGELKIGGRMPFTPLLPMPPVNAQADLKELLREPLDGECRTPKANEPELDTSTTNANTLASRRQAKRGASEGICSTCMDPLRRCTTFGCASRKQLHVDTKSASAVHGFSQPQPRSAGMIRSYSLPVATQQEYEEQHRIMALGASPVGKYTANPSWWSYGWASPGGATLTFERRPSVGPAPHERVLSPQRVLSQQVARPKASLSPSPKGKSALLSPQHASRSPNASRSPLGSMSLNLAPSEQRQPRRVSGGSSSPATKQRTRRGGQSPTRSPLARRSSMDQGGGCLSTNFERCNAEDRMDMDDLPMDEDYFSPRKSSTGTSDAGSDEALTPRAASPSLLSRSDSLGLDFGAGMGAHQKQMGSSLSQPTSFHHGNGLADLEFIHPDHLQPLPPIAF